MLNREVVVPQLPLPCHGFLLRKPIVQPPEHLHDLGYASPTDLQNYSIVLQDVCVLVIARNRDLPKCRSLMNGVSMLGNQPCEEALP